MSNKNRKDQLEAVKEKLGDPEISLLEIEELVTEIRSLPLKEPFSPEEIKINDEINKTLDLKISSFVEKLGSGEFVPNDKEAEYLEKIMINIWQNIINYSPKIEQEKESESYKQDLAHKKTIDSLEEQIDGFKRHRKVLLRFVAQRHRVGGQETISVSADNSPKPSNNLPWTFAIIFGAMVIILLGLVGFLFWQQRKMKRFRV